MTDPPRSGPCDEGRRHLALIRAYLAISTGRPAPLDEETGPAPFAEDTGPAPVEEHPGPTPVEEQTGPSSVAEPTGPSPFDERTGRDDADVDITSQEAEVIASFLAMSRGPAPETGATVPASAPRRNVAVPVDSDSDDDQAPEHTVTSPLLARGDDEASDMEYAPGMNAVANLRDEHTSDLHPSPKHMRTTTRGASPSEHICIRPERKDTSPTVCAPPSTSAVQPLDTFITFDPPLLPPDIDIGITTVPLSQDEQVALQHVKNDAQDDTVLAVMQRNRIKVTKRDLLTLEAGNCVNDVIIDGFLSLLQDRNLAHCVRWRRLYDQNPSNLQQLRYHAKGAYFKADRPRCAFLSTFFYTMLARGGASDVAGWLGRTPWNMGTVDVIFIPVHIPPSSPDAQGHWILILVDLRLCTIILMDPARTGEHMDIIRNVKVWVASEISSYSSAILAAKMNVPKWRVVRDGSFIPVQRDNVSCGVYCLYNAEAMERGCRPLISPNQMGLLRRRTQMLILHGLVPDAVLP